MTIHIIENVLQPAEVTWVNTMLKTVGWDRGTETAGPIAATVKRNWQAKDTDTVQLRAQIEKKLMDNQQFRALTRPQHVGLMFGRYTEGCEYGTHVDGASMSGSRRDISFTLELSEESYEGGLLVIEHGSQEQALRLKPGSMVVYPATSLHQVTTITKGTRTVLVGWARSLIRDADKRELLYELDLAKSSLFAKHGKTAEVDLISRSSANLMRMWMED